MSATLMSGEAAEEQEEFGFAECECCGLTEECTAAYAAEVRARFCGWWICGLCAEAVEDEICRSSRLISMEEAVKRQASFCLSFRSAAILPAPDAGDHLISLVRRLIIRSLHSSSPLLRSTSNGTPRKGLTVNCSSTIGSSRLSEVGDVDLLRIKGIQLQLDEKYTANC